MRTRTATLAEPEPRPLKVAGPWGCFSFLKNRLENASFRSSDLEGSRAATSTQYADAVAAAY